MYWYWRLNNQKRVEAGPNDADPVPGSAVPPDFQPVGEGNIIGHSRLVILVGIPEISLTVTPEIDNAAIPADMVALESVIEPPEDMARVFPLPSAVIRAE